MGKVKPHNKLPPFVALLWEMLNSKAYRALTHSSAKALPYFLGKSKTNYNDPRRYADEFTFSYSEAKRYSFSPATFSKVIQELIAKGFIDPVEKGGLRSDRKSYNIFKLTKRWALYNEQGFEHKNWKCFVPKPRLKTTSKKETYSFKKGTDNSDCDTNISLIEAVAVVLQ